MGTLTNILVLGLGASGLAVADYCSARLGSEFASVTAIDSADTDRLGDAASELRRRGVSVHLGAQRVDGLYDLCVASPGIPPHAPLMRSADAASGRVISEIEFAFEQSSNPWIAVTGTNGKTTTTSLIAHLLTAGGEPAVAVGNIGAPAILAVAEQDAQVVLVAEVSSFQLALTERFHPRVAVLLNITPDHIDWHGSYERYAQDKARVFANLGVDDVAVVDVDDLGSASLVASLEQSGARIVRVSLADTAMEASVNEGVLQLRSASGERVPLIAADELQIKGAHNVSNALSAAAAANALGVRVEDIRIGLASFSPIEHRLEPVGVARGAEWFNDSKATNPDAVSKALGAFGDRPLLLLLGGRNKGNDFGPLALEAAERASAVILFGEACGDLDRAFASSGVTVKRAQGLAEAVHVAAQLASPGDAVLLSPACASFDEFANYEDRGKTFKALVRELALEESL